MRSGALQPLCYPSRPTLLLPGPVERGTPSGVRTIRARLVSLQAIHDKWMSEALVEARKVGKAVRVLELGLCIRTL